jgi:ubiquinol-cytochrome c reductase cytochrome b subunit
MNLRLAMLAVMLTPAISVIVHAQTKTQRGADVFAKSGCLHCHSVQHVGGKKGPDLSVVGQRLSKTRMRRQILSGGEEMPAFADVLDKQELKDLLAYLHSCRDTRGR